jgi:hypothetical protein
MIVKNRWTYSRKRCSKTGPLGLDRMTVIRFWRLLEAMFDSA